MTQKEWKLEKLKALKRDNYICQTCGAKNKLIPYILYISGKHFRNWLHLHHINTKKTGVWREFKITGKAKACYVEMSELITLCPSCHRKAHWKSWGNKIGRAKDMELVFSNPN